MLVCSKTPRYNKTSQIKAIWQKGQAIQMGAYLSKYKVRKIYEDTYSIADYGINQGPVYMYLLVGSKNALLVDSGYGGIDLPAVIGKITDKPVTCLCTHGHVDHACGAYHFEKSYLHSADFGVYADWCNGEKMRALGTQGLSFTPDAQQLADKNYQALICSLADQPRGPLLPLEDVPEFDLGGGRLVTWTPIPGHTPGSVSVIDHKYKTAFDSDGAASGVWLFLPESSSVAAYRDVLAQYEAYLKQEGIQKHYVGHMGRCLNTRRNLDLLACCDTILFNRKPPYDVTMRTGQAKLMFSHDTLVFYNRVR